MTKTYQVWDYDRECAAECEAATPARAVELYVVGVDDGETSSADVGVMNDDGEWRRYRVRLYRRVDVTLDRGRDVDDPRPSEE